MAKKFYVVWQGHKAGIYDSWADCQKQTLGAKGAKYKSFPNLEEAEKAYKNKNFVFASNQNPKSKLTKKSKPDALTQNDIDKMKFDIKIFSDGACEPNPGKAGTGLAVYEQNKLNALWYGLYQENGTNNTAELNGLFASLRLARQKLSEGKTVAIYCDSSYSIKCISEWAVGWQKKGWVKKDGEIKNLDLIKKAFAIYQEIASDIELHHVNGHVGIEGNELADRMSIKAIEEQKTKLIEFTFQAEQIAELLALRRG